MCGIALVLSGVGILGPHLRREEPRGISESNSEELLEKVLLLNHLKAALRRRGPDHLGTKKLFLHSSPSQSPHHVASAFEAAPGTKSHASLEFFGATLQLRGPSPVLQPLVDSSGNVLVYNGEIFGGIHVDGNDTEALLHALEKSCSCNFHGHEHSCIEMEGKSVPEILSTLRGPWAFIYWQERSKTIWFGRDSFGRRSLLVHWPTDHDPRLVLSSVSPTSVRMDCGNVDSISSSNGFECDGGSAAVGMQCPASYWEELACGIYSIKLEALTAKKQRVGEILVGEVQIHEWTDPLLKELIKWDRTFLYPKTFQCLPHHRKQHALSSCISDKNSDIHDPRDQNTKQTNNQSDITGLLINGVMQSVHIQPVDKVLAALREAVMRRTALNVHPRTALQGKEEELAPMAVLFSGGLDSMIIAALLDQCLLSKYAIDLLNVSFDGQLAPDRVSARVGIRELQKIAPSRRWQLVEIDSCLSDLTWETKHLMSLIHPAKTYMDLNIGLALWLAAAGDGWVDAELCNQNQGNHHHYRYKSKARVLLVGSGADEQCAGYGRHRTKYRLGGWDALQEEMRLDMQRIWKRNLGRDDRCISDHGKEARFPFLDEDVIKTLLDIPLCEIVNLDEPVGRGDKKILREVACLLGLEGAAVMPKRAIQFGSRIARESNKVNFGSNRAANQASAGSVEIHGRPI